MPLVRVEGLEFLGCPDPLWGHVRRAVKPLGLGAPALDVLVEEGKSSQGVGARPSSQERSLGEDGGVGGGPRREGVRGTTLTRRATATA